MRMRLEARRIAPTCNAVVAPCLRSRQDRQQVAHHETAQRLLDVVQVLVSFARASLLDAPQSGIQLRQRPRMEAGPQQSRYGFAVAAGRLRLKDG